jgi:hypothetical protein
MFGIVVNLTESLGEPGMAHLIKILASLCKEGKMRAGTMIVDAM